MQAGSRRGVTRRAAANATVGWATEAAWRLALAMRGARALGPNAEVEGVVHLGPPWPALEGSAVDLEGVVASGVLTAAPATDVAGLATSGVLTARQAAMLAWRRARARWHFYQPEPLALPGATLEWSVLTLRSQLAGNRGAQVVFTMRAFG